MTRTRYHRVLECQGNAGAGGRLGAALAIVFAVAFTSLTLSANSTTARASDHREAARLRWTRGMTVALLGAVLSYCAALAL